eukprot:6923773-Pyramimonas_sp.AAC.1
MGRDRALGLGLLLLLTWPSKSISAGGSSIVGSLFIAPMVAEVHSDGGRSSGLLSCIAPMAVELQSGGKGYTTGRSGISAMGE